MGEILQAVQQAGLSDYASLLERFGSLILVIGAGYWILTKQIPNERLLAREAFLKMVDRFEIVVKEERRMYQESLKVEREICQAAAENIKANTRTLCKLSDEINRAMKWDGTPRRRDDTDMR